MVLAMNVMELEENGLPAGYAMEVVYVIIAMGGVAQYATTLEFAIVVTELVKNGMHAGSAMERVNVIIAMDKDGKHALIVMVKAEKHVMNVMVKAEKTALNAMEMAWWHVHIAMGEGGILAPFVMGREDEWSLVFCSFQEESWL